MQIRGAFAEVVELIPQRARVALYVAAVGMAVLALAAQRVVTIWWPDGAEQVNATVAEIMPWALFLIGLLGTAYRPGRGESPGAIVNVINQPGESSPLELAQTQERQAQTVATLMANGWTKSEATETVTQNALLAKGDSPGDLRMSTL